MKGTTSRRVWCLQECVYRENEHKIVNKDVVAFGQALKCSSGRQRGNIKGFARRITLLRSASNLQQCPGLVGRESERKER